MRLAALFFAVIFALMTPLARAADTPPYDCHWTDSPIKIDGEASDPAWQHALPINTFTIPPTHAQPKAPTTAKLLWDREYVYFYAEMEDKTLYNSTTQPEGKLWEGDVFELFFKPTAENPGYYEFEINPANTTLSLYFPARDAGGYGKFKAKHPFHLETATRKTDKGWAVEGRLKWTDFAPTGGRPNLDETWSFALCRGDASAADAPIELTSNAPLSRASFHLYEDYAKIRFARPTETIAKPFGVTTRPAWTTSKVIGSPDAPLPYTVERAFPKLHIHQALYVLEDPGTNSFFVVQHLGNWAGPGKILRVKNDPNVNSAQTLLSLDRLIYGMCLHPKYAENHYIYTISNGPEEAKNKFDRISRFTVDPAAHTIDPKSELVILEWESNGHNGGELAFGPDGYLWCPAGDGTSDSDGNIRGQDITHLTSTMIRIDVDHPSADKPYSIPKDNPFLNIPNARPEAYAFGFRNPWRMCFDAKDGTCFVGNNGQDLWEQVYIVHAKDNFGWSITEGSHPFYQDRKQGPAPIVKPAIEHPHSAFRSLTGGLVYYGKKFPQLVGSYIYGDFSTGRIWAAAHQGDKITSNKEIARTTLQIVDFATDSEGNILICDDGGEINKLIPLPPRSNASTFPDKLSDTGLFLSVKDNKPDPSLIPYDVNTPEWADGASMERFIALPGYAPIAWTPLHGWNFPEGAVLVQTLSLNTDKGPRRVETRILTRQLGQWAGYSYLWEPDQTEAYLVDAEGDNNTYTVVDQFGKHPQAWHVPSRADCMVCHARAVNFVLGPSTLQMNKDHNYNGATDNQLRTLEHLGVLKVDYTDYTSNTLRSEAKKAGKNESQVGKYVSAAMENKGQRQNQFSTLLPVPPDQLPHLVNPYDQTQDINLRARSYLHANCSICHIEAGGGNSTMDLEFTTPPKKMNIFDAPPNHTTFNLPNAKLISPGHPDSSVLLRRLSWRGQDQMPPLGTAKIDPDAVTLIRDWISQLKPLPPEEK